jgi:sec-independent protein translocase protein TatC
VDEEDAEHFRGDGSEPAADEERPASLEDIPGVGAAKAEALRDAGLSTVSDVAAASQEELAEIPGIGDVLAARIKTDAGELGETVESDDEEGDAPAVDPDEVEGGGGIFGGGRSGGPAEDREMPLADHIREMLRRLAVVIAVAGLVSLVVFPFAEALINFLWYSILPGVESEIARPRVYGVLELLFTKLKVASLAGLIVALPVLVYETYAFMKPGLYPHERRYYLAAIPTSLVLAVVGASFAYFVVLPAIFLYFLEYSQDVATIGFALGRTFDLILLLMGYMALVFQIPLFIMLAMMMGLVTRAWLAARRLLFWGAFLGI